MGGHFFSHKSFVKAKWLLAVRLDPDSKVPETETSGMARYCRGLFLVIEGLDKSGKSTQARLLCKNLRERGHVVELLSFPDRTTEIGGLLDRYLRNDLDLDERTAHLLFSANRWEAVQRIKSLLGFGCTVILDRYSFSGIAYSMLRGSCTWEWCQGTEQGLPEPDVIFFMDMDLESLKQRTTAVAERFETTDVQRRVRDNFFRLINRFQHFNWHLVDANRSIEKVQEELLRITLVLCRICPTACAISEMNFKSKQVTTEV